MAGMLLPDELWNEIEPLFPQYHPSPDGGRPIKLNVGSAGRPADPGTHSP